MRLAELLAGLPVHGTVPPVTVAGLGLDSRRIDAGDAFVALPGQRAHGLEFAADALARGACAVLHEATDSPPAALAGRSVGIEGLEGRLPELARRIWDDPAAALDLVAVTGTNGKSSVAWLLAQALDGALIGTLGIGRPGALTPASHTTPDLPGMYRALAGLRDAGVGCVALEASSHALDQRRLAGLAFSAAVFTMLGRDHLDYHGSLEAYGEAKARLFTDYPAGRHWINIDDLFGRRLLDRARADRVIGYRLDGACPAGLRGHLRRADLDGLELDVGFGDTTLTVTSSLIGAVNARNLLVVAGELLARGHDVEAVVARIAALEPVPGRMNRVDGPAGRRAVIDYAHTPDALENALLALRALTPGRLICVFGCGGERDRGKRPRMGRIAEALADRVFITNDNPRSEQPRAIVRDIQAGMERPERARVVIERGEAIALAVTQSGAGDCVLVAGKGHETTQDLGDRVIEFCDEQAVRSALGEAA